MDPIPRIKELIQGINYELRGIKRGGRGSFYSKAFKEFDIPFGSRIQVVQYLTNMIEEIKNGRKEVIQKD